MMGGCLMIGYTLMGLVSPISPILAVLASMVAGYLWGVLAHSWTTQLVDNMTVKAYRKHGSVH